MTLNNFFDRIVVISLPERLDRRRRVSKQLAQIGSPIGGNVEFFDAVRPTEAAGFPSIGARGCFLSHLAVLERSLAEGSPRTLVLEDDVVFASDFATRAPELLAQLAATKWDLAYLGHEAHGDVNGTGWVRFDGPVQCLHGYTVHPSATHRICNELRTILARDPGDPRGGPMHVDGAFCTIRVQHPEIRTILAVPPLVTQGGSRSDIAVPRWFDRAPIVRHLVQTIRDHRLSTFH